MMRRTQRRCHYEHVQFFAHVGAPTQIFDIHSGAKLAEPIESIPWTPNRIANSTVSA